MILGTDMFHDLKILEASPCYAVKYPQSSFIFHYLRTRTYNAIKIHESATAQCKRIPITAAERRWTQIESNVTLHCMENNIHQGHVLLESTAFGFSHWLSSCYV